MFELLNAKRPRIFFRDDDADRDLPELRRLLDLFGSSGTPLSLAVIPGSLDEGGARLLRDPQPWLEVHQHGWMHTNHETVGRKCEFGPSRAFAQQCEDIENGRKRLRDRLGDLCAPVFTPPWNRCTADTARALQSLGFEILSKDQTPNLGIREMSIAVDIFTWKNGPELKPLQRIVDEVAARCQVSDAPLGILLHHKVMSREAFSTVSTLLSGLRPVAEFQTLEAAACQLHN